MTDDNTIINILYTGDYTNENLGHEIINTYKSDNDNDYIYISPYGSINQDRDDKIKYVILARGIENNKETVEIVAIAEVEEQIAKGLTERPKIRFEYKEKTDSARKKEKDKFDKWVKNYRKQDNYKFCREWKEKHVEIIKKTEFETWETEFIDNYNNRQNVVPNEIKNITDFQIYKSTYESLLDFNIKENKDYQTWIKLYNLWDTKLLIWEYIRKPAHKANCEYIHGIKEVNGKKEIKEKPITYGNCPLDYIFKSNIWNETAIYVTFKAKGIYKPQKNTKLYITVDEKQKSNNTFFIKSDKKQIKNMSCKLYASITNDTFSDIKSFCTEELKKVKDSEFKNQNSFLDFIKRQNDELSYSNMLAYFFNNEKVFSKFITFLNENREMVKLKEKTIESLNDFVIDNYFKVEREKYNIDLLIHTNKFAVIIENKIKSGLNGIIEIDDNKNRTQLDKYYQIITGNTDFYNDLHTTKKEKEFFDNAYELGFNSKKSSFFIFVPNYLYNQMENRIKDLPSNENYSLISYLTLYNFFNQKDIKEYFKNNKYYYDFLIALKNQSSSTDNRIEREMEYKFRQAIEKQRPQGDK